MSINYSSLILGRDIYYENKDTKFKVHVPKVKEVAEMGEGMLNLYTRPFTAIIREIFAGAPDVVNELDDKFHTIFNMLKDEPASMEVGELLTGQQGVHLGALIIQGLAYWTETEPEDFQFLSNGTIVSEKLNWVINNDEFEEFSKYVRVIVLYKPNEDLIAPKNMDSQARKQIWLTVYNGRLRQLKQQKSHGLGEKILILQLSAGTYISAETIADMSYYQLVNLINGFAEKEQSDQQLIIYASEKFDTSNMKLRNWREKIELIKGDTIN